MASLTSHLRLKKRKLIFFSDNSIFIFILNFEYEYINVDSDLVTNGNFTLQEIVESVMPCTSAATSNDESDDDVLIEETEVTPVSRKEAQKGWDSFCQYMQQKCDDRDALSALDKLDDKFASMRLQYAVQTQIPDFFQTKSTE